MSEEINPIEALTASGLKPIVVDENTDFGELMSKRETNEEFMARVMSYGCPTGPMIQMFIIEALGAYCQHINEVGTGWPDEYVISPKAWEVTAKWLSEELTKKYGGR